MLVSESAARTNLRFQFSGHGDRNSRRNQLALPRSERFRSSRRHEDRIRSPTQTFCAATGYLRCQADVSLNINNKLIPPKLLQSLVRVPDHRPSKRLGKMLCITSRISPSGHTFDPRDHLIQCIVASEHELVLAQLRFMRLLVLSRLRIKLPFICSLPIAVARLIRQFH